MSSSFLNTCNIFIYIWNVSIIIPKRHGEVYNNVKVTFSLFKYSGLMTVIAHLLVSKNKMRRGQWSHLQLRASLAFCLFAQSGEEQLTRRDVRGFLWRCREVGTATLRSGRLAGKASPGGVWGPTPFHVKAECVGGELGGSRDTHSPCSLM